MTSVQGMIDRAAAKADTLPLPRIVAGMLAAAMAFFCLAMPPRLFDRMMGSLHLPGGLPGRLAFATVMTLLAGWIGWRAMTLVSARGRSRPRPVVRATAARPFRRAEAAEATPALRRGDAHPDAPARRPIFAARDLGRSFDELGGEPELTLSDPEPAPVRRRRFLVDGEVPMPAAEPTVVEAAVVPVEEPELEAPEREAAADAPGDDAEAEAEMVAIKAPDGAADEPLDLVHPFAAPEPAAEAEPAPEPTPEPDALAEPEPEPQPQPQPQPEPEPARPATLAALMARFESGLDRLDGEVPSPPESARVTPLNVHRLDTDEALREAIAALQRMAARQR